MWIYFPHPYFILEKISIEAEYLYQLILTYFTKNFLAPDF